MFEQISNLDIVLQSRQGKVRDVYDLGDTALIVTTDRISAFDVVFPDPIPGKGKILNGIAAHVFRTTKDIVPNHFISADPKDYPAALAPFLDYLAGRSMLVRKTRVIPFECIVRGYISGSAWAEYSRTGTIGGMLTPDDMKESQKFSQPMFTPSTKASSGHDVNISYRDMLANMDEWIAVFLKTKSVELYSHAHELLIQAGIVLADTKFEFGCIGDEILLIDEALTPDSSRFWSLDDYAIGKSPMSFDKQYIRDYLTASGWDRVSPPPHLPKEVIDMTREKYKQIYKIITGNEFQDE